jgi:hypothetical protein
MNMQDAARLPGVEHPRSGATPTAGGRYLGPGHGTHRRPGPGRARRWCPAHRVGHAGPVSLQAPLGAARCGHGTTGGRCIWSRPTTWPCRRVMHGTTRQARTPSSPAPGSNAGVTAVESLDPRRESITHCYWSRRGRRGGRS